MADWTSGGRITPNLPPEQYRTYRILAPVSTHHRAATCAEVECQAYANGWRSVIDVSTELGRKQANYIRLQSGRHFSSEQIGDTVTFTFPAGQRCFTEHRVRLDRPEIYRVQGGDWRGNPRGESRTHVNADDWVDDFATNQDRLQSRIDRG